MKLLLDACVLYPTVMREMLIGAAQLGLYQPLWSPRILEEWARAAAKIDPAQEVQARGEIALLRATYPRAEITPQPAVQNRLWLPDANDIHVLAAAVSGSAEAIITLNAKDFPRNILAEEGVVRHDPDWVLCQFHDRAPELMDGVATRVLQTANTLSGQTWTLRALMKKARLPRLGKALSAN